MKVLFVGRYNNTEILSGPEKVAKRIFNEFTKEYNSSFLEYFFDGRKYNYLKKLFGKEILINQSNFQVLKLGLFRLIFYLIKTKPRIIHIITFERFALACFFYKIFSNVKIIYNVHGIIEYENVNYNDAAKFHKLKDKFCEKIFFKYSDKLIFLSEKSISLAEKYFEFDKNKVIIIPNGIDAIFYNLSKEKINSNDYLKIVFVSNIDRKENELQFLNDALKEVNSPVAIYAIGNFNNLNLKNHSNINLILLNKMDTNDFAKFLSDKDVYISPGAYEQFSITAVEAMAIGLVPVVTEETGMSSYIENNSNGFVFKYGDKKKLIEDIYRINFDRNNLKKISDNAKDIYSRLNWEIVFGKYKNLYNECIVFDK